MKLTEPWSAVNWGSSDVFKLRGNTLEVGGDTRKQDGINAVKNRSKIVHKVGR